MRPHPSWELSPIQSAHAHFANWERAKRRAEFFAILGFPDTHPLRLALDKVCSGLEEHRWAAESTVADVAKKYGDAFCGDLNGYHFDNFADMFKSGTDMYHDYPSICVSKGVRRSHALYLQGVACIHDIETCGKRFAEAVLRAVDGARPKAKPSLVKTTKRFDKDCGKLQRALKRVKIRRRDRVDFFLCMSRKGLPTPVAEMVLDYLL